MSLLTMVQSVVMCARNGALSAAVMVVLEFIIVTAWKQEKQGTLFLQVWNHGIVLPALQDKASNQTRNQKELPHILFRRSRILCHLSLSPLKELLLQLLAVQAKHKKVPLWYLPVFLSRLSTVEALLLAHPRIDRLLLAMLQLLVKERD